MSPESVVTTIRKVAMGLQAAHDCGVVHRDLKPANIMIDDHGEPILMDFGLARRRGSQDVAVTQVGYFLGTPAYMSPEQVTGDNSQIGFTSDVYSLGVLLYELLADRRPFEGDVTQIMTDVLTKNPRPPCELKPNIDARLSDICMKAMHKDNSQRFQSAAEFADALESYLTDERPAAAIDSPANVEADTIPESEIPKAVAAPPVSMERLVAVPAILLLAAIVVAGVIKFRPTDSNFSEQSQNIAGVDARAETSINAGQNQTKQQSKLDKSTAKNSNQNRIDLTSRKLTTTPSLRNAQSDVKSLEIIFQRAGDSRWDVLHSDDVPLRAGDKIQIHVEMMRPTFVYLYWFDAEGKPNRLWPKSLDQQPMTGEIWDPPRAANPEKQKWHLIGGPVGMESVIVATSEKSLGESELREFEKTKLRIAWLNESGKPVTFGYDPERGLVAIVEAPKHPTDEKNRAYLIVPEDSARRLVLIDPAEQERAIVGTVESPKLPRTYADFHSTLRNRFQSYSGFVLPHDSNNNGKR